MIRKARLTDVKKIQQLVNFYAKKDEMLPLSLNDLYDKIRDFKMDPKGYFLIKIDPKNKTINAGYCTIDNILKIEIIGKNALEIINTIIKENLISSLQHAADLGIELHKAEIALKKGIKYTQDSSLEI